MIKSAILTVLAALSATSAGGIADAVMAPETYAETAVCASEMSIREELPDSAPETEQVSPEDSSPDSVTGKPDGGKHESRRPHRGHGGRGESRPDFGRTPGKDGGHRPMPLPYFDGDSAPVPPSDGTDDVRPEPRDGKTREKGAENFMPGEEDGTQISCGISEYVLGKITPEFIALYEEKVAHADVVTGMSEAELSLAADNLGIDVRKMKALLLLQDLVSRTSRPVPVSVLADMSDGDLLRLARKSAKAYASSLSESEREELKAEFKAVLKK